jgi:hypothetical protein
MLIRFWIQDALAANIFIIGIGKQAQFRYKIFMMILNKGKITKEMIAMFSTCGIPDSTSSATTADTPAQQWDLYLSSVRIYLLSAI